MNQERFAGAAVATPLTPDLGIDHACLVTHITQLLERGINLLPLFGTTGEGASFSRTERNEAIRRCREAGISTDQLGSGVFALSSVHAGDDARAAFDNGCGHVLLAPPCYFKSLDDEGLYRWFSEAIESAGANPGQFVLYHIPGMTQVELSGELVSRLAAQFPGVVTGVKDSSGNWSHTERLIRERGTLNVFVGHEGQLERGMRIGASGAIAGSANILPEVIKAIVHDDNKEPNLPLLIDELLKYPIIPAVKALIASRLDAPAWLRVRPPLTQLASTQIKSLGERLDALFPN